MRKKSKKYRPKGVRLDAVQWVIDGMKKVTDKKSEYLTLHLKNMSALDSLVKGTANKREMDIVINVVNVSEALCKLGIGADMNNEVLRASDALFAVCKRSFDLGGRFVCRGEEIALIKEAYLIHDAQMEMATLADLDRALDLIHYSIRYKHAKVIKHEDA